MKLQRFEAAGLAQYAYVLSSQGEAVVIDPVRDVEAYLEYATEQGLRITYVVETHIHADFASGATALAQRTEARLALSAYDKGEVYTYAFEHQELHDGESFAVGALRVQAMHTPGHTPEHLSFVVFDRSRAADVPVALFSGDFLFVGSLGRPDLLGEEAKRGLAHDLYRSLHEGIAGLPDALAVYPGHGAGSLCGAGLGEMPTTTLGYERATNAMFAMDEENFVESILASVPPMPKYYPRMKALNAAGAPILTELPGGRALTLVELQALKAKGAVLLDTRRPEAFGGAHVPGAISMGADQNVPLWAGWLLEPERPIVLIGEAGAQESVRRDLVRVGIDSAVGYVAQGMPGWIQAGFPLARVEQVSAAELPEGVQVLDVRTEAEWDAGHMEGALHGMLGDLSESNAVVAALDRARPVLVVCGSGYRSSIAASMLLRMGFGDVRSLAGGMSAYKKAGLPIVM